MIESADRRPGNFGRKLRDARERRGLSLRQVANATKIALPTLEALERNDISRLPGGIFSRAFVRSYATEVGLDPDEAIEEFIAEFPHDAVTAGHGTAAQEEDNEAVESERRIATTVLRIICLSIPIAGALLYFSGKGRRAELAANVSVAATSPHERRAESALEVPIQVSPPAGPSTMAGTRPAEAASRDAATPIRAASPAATAPISSPVPAVIERLMVGLSTSRSTWVSATVDGRKAFEGLLEPGKPRTMEVRRELVLTARDAAALNLTLNGAEARPLGKTDEIVTARLNPTNFREFLPAR